MRACVAYPLELFFGPDQESQREREDRVARAVLICGGCEERVWCALEAERVGERFGVWGGVDREGPSNHGGVRPGAGSRRAVVERGCGTYAGYRSHTNRGERPCAECEWAGADYRRARRQIAAADWSLISRLRVEAVAVSRSLRTDRGAA